MATVADCVDGWTTQPRTVLVKQLDRGCDVSLLVDRQRVPLLLEFVCVLDFPHPTTLLPTHITCKLFFGAASQQRGGGLAALKGHPRARW